HSWCVTTAASPGCACLASIDGRREACAPLAFAAQQLPCHHSSIRLGGGLPTSDSTQPSTRGLKNVPQGQATGCLNRLFRARWRRTLSGSTDDLRMLGCAAGSIV